MKYLYSFLLGAAWAIFGFGSSQAQISGPRWSAEFNVLWPIFPGNIYKPLAVYRLWQQAQLAGDLAVGLHIRPFEFRPEEGDFSNYALTLGYRQYVWRGLHFEAYQAFGPGFNRNNVVNGADYVSWDYEVGAFAGYRWWLGESFGKNNTQFRPYVLMQHGLMYLAAQSNPHPIVGQTAERPFYAGSLHIGLQFGRK